MEKDTPNILVIDDEENMCHMLQTILKNAGYRVDTSSDPKKGLEKVKSLSYDLVLCDMKMPGMDGISLLKKAEQALLRTSVIMMSAYGTIDTAIKAVKLGAYDFISKPFNPDEMLIVVEKALEKLELKNENIELKQKISEIEQKYQFDNIIAKSSRMQMIFRLLEKVAGYDTTVLITGESGTGKELIAKAIYFNSNRRDKSLVPVNCAGIPENLLESELFGYKKGAFTGADKDKKGLFEKADKGIVFLDEIGDMPLSLQVKLLRVLQENEIMPLGATGATKVDVRVLAATSKDLKEEVGKGRFREDLYYRLNVMPVNLPALKERKEDIPLLCDFFISRYNERFDKTIQGIDPKALSRFFDHDWPGNVRELENAIERAVILAEKDILDDEVLHIDAGLESEKGSPTETDYSGFSIKEGARKLEKLLIEKALKETGGNRTRASKLLEISHPSLLSKMKQYGIQ